MFHAFNFGPFYWRVKNALPPLIVRGSITEFTIFFHRLQSISTSSIYWNFENLKALPIIVKLSPYPNLTESRHKKNILF